MLQSLARPRLEYLADVAEQWQGKDVLDLSCGGGFMAEALAARGAKVVGVDPSESAIAIAKKHASTIVSAKPNASPLRTVQSTASFVSTCWNMSKISSVCCGKFVGS